MSARYVATIDGAELRRIREAKGLTQEALVSRMPRWLRRQQVSRMERGQMGQGVANFHDVAEGLGMTMDELWAACVRVTEVQS